MPDLSDRDILLRLIGSITLADHLGDVAGYVEEALKLAKVDVPEWGDLDELGGQLGEMGIPTLYGTSLSREPGEE